MDFMNAPTIHETNHRASVRLKNIEVPASRNRAIDAYRALAMFAVAFGHWLAADVRLTDGTLAGGNALDQLRSLHILTWVFQVMPIFFCIGGYSNAASLDAHRRNGGSNSVWVRARLRRLTTPSAWLAGTWLVIVGAAHFVGFGRLATVAAGVAAIPLWFLGNYVADTALAPITLNLYRNRRRHFLTGLAVVFLIGEALRFPGVHYLPQINIIVGWLIFQVLGFAWKDGHLPGSRCVGKLGIGSFGVAAALVAFGPWPLAMVSVPGSRFANTWPPSLALIFYGFGMCSLAIAAAPRINTFLGRSKNAWTAVAGANTITMTSYLWHFTALSIAAVVLAPLHLLPTAAIGSGAWWWQKLVVIATAFVVLVGLVTVFAKKERAGLLGADKSGSVAVSGSPWFTGPLALTLAASFECWTAAAGNRFLLVSGMAGVVSVHRVLGGKSGR